jgi:hypothetical protein
MKRSDSKKKSVAADPFQALHRDALKAARALKGKHRTLCERGLDAVRKTIRKAHPPSQSSAPIVLL